MEPAGVPFPHRLPATETPLDPSAHRRGQQRALRKQTLSREAQTCSHTCGAYDCSPALTCSHTHTHKQGHTQTWAGACRGRTGSVLQGQHLSWAPWTGSGWPAAPCCPRVASEGSWGWGWRLVPAWPCLVCDLAPFTARHLTFIPPITVFPTMSRKWTPPMAHRVGAVCQPLGWSQTWG